PLRGPRGGDRGGALALQAPGFARALPAQLLRSRARRHPGEGQGAHQVEALVNRRAPAVLVVPREAGGARLDRFLAGALDVSRSEVQRWIAAGRVTVEGAPRSASGPVRGGERVACEPM